MAGPAFDESQPFEEWPPKPKAAPAPTFDEAKPTEEWTPKKQEVAAEKPSVSTIDDVLKSLPGDVVKTGLRTLGSFTGDVRETNAALINWLSKKLGYEVSPETASRILRHTPMGGVAPGMPSSNEMINLIERHAGKFYEPQTPTGKAVEFGIELAPNLYGGEGSLLTKLGTRVIAPMVAGQSLENLAKGTVFEPYAKSAGAIGTQLLGGLRGLTPAARRAAETELQAVNAAREARESGITLTRPQARGDQAALLQLEQAKRGDFGPAAQREALAHEAQQAAEIEQARTGVGERVGAGVPPENLGEDVGLAAREARGRMQAVENATNRIEQSVQQRAEEEVARRTRILQLERETFLSTFGERHPAGSVAEAAEKLGETVQQRAGRLSLAGAELPKPKSPDVVAAVKKIVENNSTPEEIAAQLTGGKKGPTGLNTRLAEYLGDVFGHTSDTWNLVKQALVRKAMDVTTKTGEFDGPTAAKNLFDMTGSSLGKTVFKPNDINSIKGMGQAVRDLDGAIANINTAAARRVEAVRGRAEAERQSYQRLFETDAPQNITGRAYYELVNGTMNPGDVVRMAFTAIGRGNPVDAGKFIGAVRRIFGDDSPQVAMIREGVLDRFFRTGGAQPSRRVIAERLTNFLDSPVGQSLYGQHAQELRRFATSLQRTLGPAQVPRVVREGFFRPGRLLMDAILGGAIYHYTGHALAAILPGGVHFGTHMFAHYLFRHGWGRLVDRSGLSARGVRQMIKPQRTTFRAPYPELGPAAVAAGTQLHNMTPAGYPPGGALDRAEP